MVTSSHHMDATMQDGRVHRMTELFGRLAPGADLEQARAELRTAHGAMLTEHAEDYPVKDDFRIDAVQLRDQITSPARTVLLVLLAASGLIFIIACSNVANLILARSVRREGELRDSRRARRRPGGAAPHAAGREPGALRRRRDPRRDHRPAHGGGAGALRVALLGARAGSDGGFDLALGRRQPRARSSAVLLAFVPRLPSADATNGFGLSTGSVRITTGTNRRLRVFAITQIAASFVLLAGAGMLITTLIALQRTQPGMNTHNVLAVNVPVNFERPPAQTCRSTGR